MQPIGLKPETARKLQRMLADRGSARRPDRPTQATTHHMLVRCLEQTKAGEDSPGDECYSAVIIEPAASVAYPNLDEVGNVWLTVLGPNGPETPVRDAVYLCRITGYLDVDGDERPRAFAEAGDNAGPVWVCGRPAEGQGWTNGGTSIDGMEGLDTDDALSATFSQTSVTNPSYGGVKTVAQIKLPKATKGTRWVIYGHARCVVTLPSGSDETWSSGSPYGFLAQLYSRSVGGSNARYRTLWIETPQRLTINAGHASEAEVTFGNTSAAGGTQLVVKDFPTTESDETIVDLQIAWSFACSVPSGNSTFTVAVSEWELYAVRHPSTQLCCYHEGDDPPTITVDTVETTPEATVELSDGAVLVYTLEILDTEDGYPTDVSVVEIGDLDVLSEASITSVGSGLWELEVKPTALGQSSVRVKAVDSRGQVAYWTATIYVVDSDGDGPEITTP